MLSEISKFSLTAFEHTSNSKREKHSPIITGHYRSENNILTLQFCIDDEHSTIDWPDITKEQITPNQQESRRKNELWKSTCFEMFAASQSSNSYREYNFAGNGDWNCYQFNDYRDSMSEADINDSAQPQTQYSQPSNTQYVISITMPTSILPSGEPGQLDIGLSSVIKYKDGTYDYFALTHCSAQADFHIRESFILSL